MLITTVMMASAIVLSSAQPSPETCNEAMNATFGDGTRNATTCGIAYSALRSGNTTEEQLMMVCSTSQCNSMIENIINLCGNTNGNTNEFPTLSLLCPNGSNGVNCLFTFSDAMANNTVEAALMAVTTDCATCSQTCRQNLMVLSSTFGCCLAEGLQTQMRNANESMVNSVINALEVCDLPIQSCNNGSILPSQNTSSLCTNATLNLFDPNDECSRAVQELLNDNGNGSMIRYIFNDDCPIRLHGYATVCSMDNDRLLQIATTVVAISQATTSNGRHCSEFVPEFVPVFLSTSDNGITCTSDFFKNQCSNTCKQMLLNQISQYGCCFNTIVGESTGRSNVFHDQIDYAILTRDIYSLCGISSGGFCAEINPPSYTNAAERCISARNSFFGDSTCLDYYLTLGERASATAVNNAATAICASQRCKNRMSSYINYLTTCQLRSFEDDKDDNEDDNDFVEEAYLIGNTTCRVDSVNNTCYSSILFDQQYAMVAAAFDTNNSNAECASMMMTQVACPSACMQLFTEARDSVGCCLGEYGRVVLGDEFIDATSTDCNVTLNVRCAEIQAIQDVNDGIGDGANAQKGLGVLAILLHGIITTWLLF